jgi:amino acid adenylation domain-containing protein
LSLEYNSELYEAETAERMLRNYEALVEALANHSGLQISEMPLASAERERVLVEWNQTSCGYEDQKTVPELFEEQVRIAPEQVAVDHEGEQLTYSELNRRSNQLAHHLRSLGVGPDAIVGICVDQSPVMAIGILGILKAGGAYLPLDPAYPRDRLQYMLEDSRASLLLTQKSLLEVLPETTDVHSKADGLGAGPCPVVLLDADLESMSLESESNPGLITTPRNLAYVIYTSGSTGRPKGVMLEHRGVANLRTAQQNAFGVGPGSRVLQFSSFSFDASVWETIMALLTGGTLCFAGGRASLWDGSDATRMLRDQGITVVTLPPSLLAVLRSQDLPALETIISAGESCSSEIAERWSVGRRFWNAYGPTETTVCATMMECSKYYPQGPPIGRPISNTQVYILDEFGNPTPLGVAGELHVASAGLARGYLNRPGLTAEKFIPNQFSKEPGSRLYRTGDLARYLSDGNIEYLGRIDQQVKVRGYRIELGEIESLLAAHETVSLAAVKAHEYPSGEKRLVAYVVPAAGMLPDISELRGFIKEKLPEYMVPSVIITMDALPLTPNGKVDKKALPAPEGRRTVAAAAFVAPQNEFEERIAGIWREALQIEKVGINDNFFDLGGHSLLLLRIHTQLQQACNRDLALITLFKFPTIGSLSRHLSEEPEDKSAIDQAQQLADQRQQRAQKQRAALGQQRKSLSQRTVSV